MILLSFDIEEFDAPLEHGVELPFEEQMRTSVEGTRKILACLARHRVKATFFCTANFALHAKDLILDIQKGGHEIASHGFYHSSFETADLRKSKEALEELTGQPVNGFRMARMMPVEEEEGRLLIQLVLEPDLYSRPLQSSGAAPHLFHERWRIATARLGDPDRPFPLILAGLP